MCGEPTLAVPVLVALINMLEIECWRVEGSTSKIEEVARLKRFWRIPGNVTIRYMVIFENEGMLKC